MLKEKGGESASATVKKYLRAFYGINNRIAYNAPAVSFPDSLNGILPHGEITAILVVHGIVEEFPAGGFLLNPKLHSKINKFVMQNLSFPELNKALRDIDAKSLHSGNI